MTTLEVTAVKIVIVEDDERFAKVLTRSLSRCGYDVLHVGTAREALTTGLGDLVLLDLNLPDGDGQELCARLRETCGVAIIVLSGRFTEHDRVTSLRSGADDYLVKPFGFGELLARIEAVLRRVKPEPVGELNAGTLRLDLDRHQATIAGEALPLNRKEFHLLALLASHPDQVQSRERLVAEVWHSTWSANSRTLDVHIARLRSKLSGRARIETVRGVGYQLSLVPGGRTPLKVAPVR
jgi:DNA-binding response OmpR family regulator